jgi:Putative MetA-pathway of phenol degradation
MNRQETSMLAVANRVSIWLFAVVLVTGLTGTNGARAVDTEHLFGFTTGADVGKVGERELETELTGRSGKQAGSYNASNQTFEAKITPIENLRLSAATALAYFDVSGVPGLMDRRQIAPQGLMVEARYRLVSSDRGPFSLTIIAAPRWDRADEISGAASNGYGGTLTAAIDTAIVANRLFGAVNVLYDAEAANVPAANGWQHDSRFGASVALSTQVQPGFFIGGEVRYLRAFDGMGLDRFAGHAVLAGPTMYYQLSPRLALSAAWSFQVAGQTASGGGLDLVHFERHQAKFRLNYNY